MTDLPVGGAAPDASLPATLAPRAGVRAMWRRPSARRYVFGYTLLAPAVLYVGLLVGLPFVFSLYLAMSDASVGEPIARFVGLENFRAALESPTFYFALRNSLVFTIGAVLWFPIVQPLLEHGLNDSIPANILGLAKLLVPLLGASYLLHSAAFLVIWFVALWMLLRWDTQRRANRLIRRWSNADVASELSLAGACVQWMDELLEPLRVHELRTSEIAKRVNEIKAASGVA